MSHPYKSLISGSTPVGPHRAAPQAFDKRGTVRRSEGEAPGAQVRTLPLHAVASRERPTEQIGRALVAVRNGHRSERIRAARELGDIAVAAGVRIPEAVVPLSVTLAGDRDPAVRQEAAWALWKIGDDRAHNPLLRALLDDDAAIVREKAARALGLMGARESVPVMIDLISLERHIPARLRAGIACAFGYLAEERLLPYLIKTAAEAEPLVRYESVRSLGRFLVGFTPEISARVLKLLLRSVRPATEPSGRIRRAAIKALRFATCDAAVDVVARSLTQDPDPEAREAAADALLLWGGAVSEAALIRALSDEIWPVRKAAARSLSRSFMRHGVFDSTAACEALRRMERMFPAHSLEWRLAAEAFASL